MKLILPSFFNPDTETWKITSKLQINIIILNVQKGVL